MKISSEGRHTRGLIPLGNLASKPPTHLFGSTLFFATPDPIFVRCIQLACSQHICPGANFQYLYTDSVLAYSTNTNQQDPAHFESKIKVELGSDFNNSKAVPKKNTEHIGAALHHIDSLDQKRPGQQLQRKVEATIKVLTLFISLQSSESERKIKMSPFPYSSKCSLPPTTQ